MRDNRCGMRAVVQRVSEASVEVDGRIIGAVGAGLLILLGVAVEDGTEQADALARKVSRLRIFEGEDGRFDRSVRDVGGGVLVVSQFTLLADAAKGNRPSFTNAAPPEHAELLYERFGEMLAAEGVVVARGVFGARMRVALVNDGPVTIILDAQRPGGNR